MIKLTSLILMSTLAGILYRAGGMSKDDTTKPKWIPKWLRKSWVRDWLCPVCLFLVFSSFLHLCSLLSWVMLLFSYVLSGGALSTYWDWISGEDDYYLHGLGCGLATIPLIWCGVPLVIILSRIVICSIGMGLWCALIGDDVWEEFGRGSLFIL